MKIVSSRLVLFSAILALSLPTPTWAASWFAQDSTVANNLYDVSFSSTQDGIAVGQHAIYTNDGGITWQDAGYEDIISLLAVDTNGDNALAVGGLGAILTSTSKGATWTTQSSGTTKTLYGADVYHYEPALGAAATYMWAAGSNGTVLYSEDLGATWDDVSVSTTEDFYDIAATGRDDAFVVGTSGTVFLTEDGGATWTDMSPSTSFDLFAIDAYENTFWIAGEGEYIAISTNFGSSWSQLSFSGRTILQEISDIDFVSATVGDMVRTGGGIWHTTNGGSSWSETTGSEDTTYNAVSVPSSGYSWAVADNGVVHAYDAVAPTAPTAFTSSSGSTTTDTTPTLTWTAATDTQSAITYEIQRESGVWTNIGNVTTYTWPIALATGTSTFAVRAIDAGNNVSASTSLSLTITTATDVPSVDTSALIKTACSAGATINDPCKAVYFYGEDGKRHAFPNEKVYFTWYEDFDAVITVSSSFMASLTLGTNVTYHPGTKMVKFITVNTVYAVGEEGELRAIASESIASALYGSDWNTKIDDISDAFFGNYRFGTDIDSTSDYDPEATEVAVTSINEIL